MPRKHLSQIQADEHSRVSKTDGKKVFVIDNIDNQIIDFGGDKAPTSGNNPAFVLGYDASFNMTSAVQIISGATYTKSLLYDANNSLVTVGVWVAI